MKKERNYSPYPVYPVMQMQSGMMPVQPGMSMQPGMNMQPSMTVQPNMGNTPMPNMPTGPNNMVGNTIENQLSTLTNQMNNLERRISAIETTMGTTYNSSYQMM